MDNILENTALQHDIKLCSTKLGKKGQCFSTWWFKHGWML